MLLLSFWFQFTVYSAIYSVFFQYLLFDLQPDKEFEFQVHNVRSAKLEKVANFSDSNVLKYVYLLVVVYL